MKRPSQNWLRRCYDVPECGERQEEDKWNFLGGILSLRWNADIWKVERLLFVVPFLSCLSSRHIQCNLHKRFLQMLYLACCLNSCWCADTCGDSRLTFLDMSQGDSKGSRCPCEAVSNFVSLPASHRLCEIYLQGLRHGIRCHQVLWHHQFL